MPRVRAGRNQKAGRRQIRDVRAILQILPAAIPALLVQEAECGRQGANLIVMLVGAGGKVEGGQTRCSCAMNLTAQVPVKSVGMRAA